MNRKYAGLGIGIAALAACGTALAVRAADKAQDPKEAAFRRAQQGELDAVNMYLALSDTVKEERDASLFRQLASEEGRHASVFRSLSQKTLRPNNTKAVVLPLLYRIIGRRRLYPLIARGEYDAYDKYAPLIAENSEIISVRDDEKRHGDLVMALLQDE